MEYIIGILAMLVAFVALLLTTSNSKKIEEGNRELKTQIKADVNKICKKLEKKMDDLEENMEAFGMEMRTVPETQTQSKEAIAVLEKKLTKTSQELSDLTQSIPPQFRQNRG